MVGGGMVDCVHVPHLICKRDVQTRERRLKFWQTLVFWVPMIESRFAECYWNVQEQEKSSYLGLMRVHHHFVPTMPRLVCSGLSWICIHFPHDPIEDAVIYKVVWPSILGSIFKLVRKVKARNRKFLAVSNTCRALQTTSVYFEKGLHIATVKMLGGVRSWNKSSFPKVYGFQLRHGECNELAINGQTPNHAELPEPI